MSCYPRSNSWIDQLPVDRRAELEEETSRATAAMPDLLRLLLARHVAGAYLLLLDYRQRNELDRRFASFALHQLSQRFAEPT